MGSPTVGALGAGVPAGVRWAGKREGNHCLGSRAPHVAGEAGASSLPALHLGAMNGDDRGGVRLSRSPALVFCFVWGGGGCGGVAELAGRDENGRQGLQPEAGSLCPACTPERTSEARAPGTEFLTPSQATPPSPGERIRQFLGREERRQPVRLRGRGVSGGGEEPRRKRRAGWGRGPVRSGHRGRLRPGATFFFSCCCCFFFFLQT